MLASFSKNVNRFEIKTRLKVCFRLVSRRKTANFKEGVLSCHKFVGLAVFSFHGCKKLVHIVKLLYKDRR